MHISPPEYVMVDLKCKGSPTTPNQGQAYLIIYGIKGPFIFYEGGGAGGIREAPFKNCMTPLSLPIFFTWPPLEAVIFLVDPPPPKEKQYIYI